MIEWSYENDIKWLHDSISIDLSLKIEKAILGGCGDAE